MCIYEDKEKLEMFKRQYGMNIYFMRLDVMQLINQAW